LLTSILRRRIRRSYPPVASDGNAFLPATETQWQERGIIAPRSWWLCQDASGDLDDAQTVSTDFDLVANAAPSYQNIRTGWNGFWVGYTDGTANQRFALNNTGTWDPTTTSMALLAYYQITVTPAATRIALTVGSSATGAGGGPVIRLQTNGRLNIVMNGVSVAGAYNYVDGGTHPLLLVYNRTGSSGILFTDQEQITGTYSASVGNISSKGFGGSNSASGTFGGFQRFGAGWLGADAEAQGRDTLLRLGWALAY
jgi:hypothetical protein